MPHTLPACTQVELPDSLIDGSVPVEKLKDMVSHINILASEKLSGDAATAASNIISHIITTISSMPGTMINASALAEVARAATKGNVSAGGDDARGGDAPAAANDNGAFAAAAAAIAAGIKVARAAPLVDYESDVEARD
jgi:hypothetical protein